MRHSIVSYLEDFTRRPGDEAYAFARGLRTYRWPYGRVAATATQFARELEERGIGKGDRVLLWAENSAEWVVAFFGCLLRRSIVVPLDQESNPEFVMRVQREVEAKLLLRSAKCQFICGKKGHLRSKEPLSERRKVREFPEILLDELPSLVAHQATDPYDAGEINRDDLVEIVFTSGTTAEPRGVSITHGNLLANLAPIEDEIHRYLKFERLVHPLRFLCAVPLSHVFGQFMGIFIPQLLFGEAVLVDSLKPAEIVKTIKREKISVLATVPRVLELLRDSIERDYERRGRLNELNNALDASAEHHFIRRWWTFRRIHWKFGWKFWALVSGGAALSAETEKFWRRLGFAVLQGYGMTETAALVSVSHPFQAKSGSIGRALPGQEIRLDENGEILVRGANVTPSYWNQKRQAFDEDGWLHTGDLAEMDEQGNLYFKGRKKEVIVTAAGMNIYPKDIEAALNRQPEVRASTVIGIDGPKGAEPIAVLILRDDDVTKSGEIVNRVIEHANESVNRYQRVRHWFVWPEADFPRTATQKIRRQAIAERIKRETESSLLTRQPSSEFAKLIAQAGGEPPQQLKSELSLATDLKLDSLGRVELLSALEERYQIEIDEAQFTDATTLGEVERLIRAPAPGVTGIDAGRPATNDYPYPKFRHRFPFTWIRTAVYYLIVLPATRLLCPLTIRGREHLQDHYDPVLIVANHVTMVDHALIIATLPARIRHRLAIAMDGELLRGWLHPPKGTGWFTRLRLLAQYWLVVAFFNVFPMPQQSGFRRSFVFAGEMMDRGYSILVFPEGRRSPDGKLGSFRVGTGILAGGLNAPVIPMRIDGLFDLKQRHRHHAQRGEVAVTIGEPVRYIAGMGAENLTRDLETRVEAL